MDSAAWMARKLAEMSGRPPPQPAPVQRPGTPPQTYAATQYQPGQDPANISAYLASDGAGYRGPKTQSELASDRCPGCGGGNYFAIGDGVVNTRNGSIVKRMLCADCNYPLKTEMRNQPSAKGIRSGGGEAPTAAPARQLGAGYQPVVDGMQVPNFQSGIVERVQ